MTTVPIVMTGFGHVGRAFLTLIKEKEASVRLRYGIGFELMALAKSDGAFFDGRPLDSRRVSKDGAPWVMNNPAWHPDMQLSDILGLAGPGCVVDCTPSDLKTGEPGLHYLTAALERGWNVVTAGKGALVVAFGRLRAMARDKGLALRYSGATAAALPTLDVGLIALAGSQIEGIQGILNGTSNYILTRMAEGLSYSDALHVAQSHGIAEPDPSYDVDGWDSAAKLVLIANTCLDTEITLDHVKVTGIRGVEPGMVRDARKEGKSIKLLASASPGRKGRGWSLEVGPSVLDASHALFHVEGTEKGITFLSDTMGSVTVTGGRSNPRGAAAALLKDLVNIYRSRS